MSYVEVFVAAVPAANADSYRKHAAQSAAILREFGARRIVDTWGDDVPDGKTTDFRRAVNATSGEVIVFSWQEYATKDSANSAYQKMMSDPRMKELKAAMPFDGRRMIYGGFTPIVDTGSAEIAGYVDASLVPVPSGNEASYRELASTIASVIREHGASRVVEAWGTDVPVGEITDYRRAVKAAKDETVVSAWILWPSKQVRDAGWRKIIADPRMHPDTRIHSDDSDVLSRSSPLGSKGVTFAPRSPPGGGGHIRVPGSDGPDDPGRPTTNIYEQHRRVHGGFATILDTRNPQE
jgi:uncharacterized protein YbaA (DUF1428 family)